MATAFDRLTEPFPSHPRVRLEAVPAGPDAFPEPEPEGVPDTVPDLELPERVDAVFDRLVGAVGARLGVAFLWACLVVLVGVAAAAGLLVVVRTASDIGSNVSTASPARPITLSPLATRTVVYARDGSVLAELHAEEDRVPIPLDKVPPHVVQAV